MARLVRRRHTAPRQPDWTPRAPWTYRPEYHEGAPRACRSSFFWPVRSGGAEVGGIDRMLRFYSHWGATPVSAFRKIDGVWFILYDEIEWRTIQEYGFWIEFVNDSTESVARISREDANRFVQQMNLGERKVYAIPFNQYTTHRRTTT